MIHDRRRYTGSAVAGAPSDWRHVKRVLAIRLDNIGDVVMLGPALRAVKEALPEAQITLMASPAGSQAAAMLPWVDDVMPQRVIWQDVSGAMAHDLARETDLVERVRVRGFDAALIFTSFSQTPYAPAYVAYLAGIPIRAGQSREFGGGLLTHWVKPLPDYVHQTDRNLFLLESVGFSLAGRHLELSLPADLQTHASRLLQDVGIGPGTPFVALAPGASAAARRYELPRFAAVARTLQQRIDLPLVILGSERESDLVPAFVEQAPGAVSLVGRTSVPELAGIIRRASLLVANNSGTLHIADAFRVPMVILYSGTDEETVWRPRSAAAQILRRATHCAPCYAFDCPYGMECLDIPPEEVVDAAVKMLGGVECKEALTPVSV